MKERERERERESKKVRERKKEREREKRFEDCREWGTANTTKKHRQRQFLVVVSTNEHTKLCQYGLA
jgi:hypothetical protein